MITTCPKNYSLVTHSNILVVVVSILLCCCGTPSFVGAGEEQQEHQELRYSFYARAPLSGVPVTSDAIYSCSFRNLWTQWRHPHWYPKDAKWGMPFIMVHSDKFIPWQVGKNASAGFVTLTKTGVPFDMTVEFLSSGEAAKDMEMGTPQDAINVQQMQKLGDLKATRDTPYFTSVANMRPSPDWFTGFWALDLRQKTTNPETPLMWYRSFTVDSNLFSAGIMSGRNYTQPGTEYSPHRTIFRWMPGTNPPRPMVLLDSTRTKILPFAQWNCNLQNAVPLPPRTSPPVPPPVTAAPVAVVQQAQQAPPPVTAAPVVLQQQQQQSQRPVTAAPVMPQQQANNNNPATNLRRNDYGS